VEEGVAERDFEVLAEEHEDVRDASHHRGDKLFIEDDEVRVLS
jgi:hypothetical protein